MLTAAAFEDVHRDAEYFEYSKAADPIGLKLISRVPYHDFPASLYKDGPTRIVALDLSKELGVDYSATGPGLLAHFVRVVRGDQQGLNPVATSQLLYVLAGNGTVTQGAHEIEFTAGAFVALPGGIPAMVRAETDTALYYVNDAPLLSYLGVNSVSPRFAPTLYPAREANAKLEEVEHAPDAAKHNRISVLLGNKHFPQTRTVTTHVGDVRHHRAAFLPEAAPAPVDCARPHRRLHEGLLHAGRHRARWEERDRQSRAGRLGARPLIRNPTRLLAFPLQRNGRASARDPAAGCRPAQLFADARYPLHVRDERSPPSPQDWSPARNPLETD
jgi:hypothetical protein